MPGGMHFHDPQPVRYTGSKWRIADWIIGFMPQHEIYVEPFCGGASVFFRKDPVKIEVLNDLNGEVVNFFEVLRNREADLLRAIELTPYAEDEWEQSFKPSDDPLERARRFYIGCRQTFGGQQGVRSGWRLQRSNARGGQSTTGEWARLEGLAKAVGRLKNAQITNRDANAIIKKMDAPGVMFYVDPPYVLKSRSNGSRKRYVLEMDDEGHRKLAKTLCACEGMVLLSGYSSELYEELYPGWQCASRNATTNGNSSATECLWLSPTLLAASPRLF